MIIIKQNARGKLLLLICRIFYIYYIDSYL